MTFPIPINWDKVVIDCKSGYVNDDFIKNIKTYQEIKPKS